MTRSAARRASAIQDAKSTPPISDFHSDDAQAVPASGAPWYWRFALFLWGTSYVCLMLYEWLAGIFKS
jgi:hypothetical protein